MATLAELNDARAKYHQLVTGQLARVFVDQNGERVEFIAARRSDLWEYIQQLENDLGIGCAEVRRPARFLF